MRISDYVTAATVNYFRDAQREGVLAARPVRLDGFTAPEVDRIVQAIEPLLSPGRARILGPLNNESLATVNAERATRYRNEVDAGVNRDGFVLLVPQGQLVESSLDEPAFLVINRGGLFRAALSKEKSARGLSGPELEAVREAARFKHPESIYAFLVHWDQVSGQVVHRASHEFLGLLSDSDLSGDIDTLRTRLRDNARATELLLQTGVSPGRILDELGSVLGLDVDLAGDKVLELIAWWHSGSRADGPDALDFATWPRSDPRGPVVHWEPNLSLPPHVGWQDNDGRVEVQQKTAKSTLHWSASGQTPDTAYELELVEENSQQVVARIGRTRSNRRQITWARVFKGPEAREELRELNPAGDEEGYLFHLRLKVFVGKQWQSEFESLPFTLEVEEDLGETTTSSPAPTAYHALYRFHVEQRASSPSVHSFSDDHDNGGAEGLRVVVRSDERRRESTLDISSTMHAIEQAILAKPRSLGPWTLDLTNGEQWTSLGHAEGGPKVSSEYLQARETAFELLSGFGSVEAADLRRGDLRSAVLEYVSAFGTAVDELLAHVSAIGGQAAQADRLRASAWLSLDAVVVRFRPDGESDVHEVLLLAPTSPPVLAWLLGLQDLLQDWSRGRYDKELKPSYREVVERLSAGPRGMVWPTPGADGEQKWWGFAGNLTSVWQCFLPIGADAALRSLPWEETLTRLLGLQHRPIGMGPLDARRIGAKIKKYAVLHPYVGHLRVAAVMAGNGQPLLDALKVVDERPNTPAGAQSVSEIRYELTLIGPRSNNLGRAIEDMTLSPGENRWGRYSAAIMDNPETLLAPGFAFARRPVEHSNLWGGVHEELKSFGDEGLHLVVLGPMLTASVGIAPVEPGAEDVDSLGLTARPSTVELPALDQSPYVGNWLLQVSSRSDEESPLASRVLSTVATACNLAFGTSDQTRRVGLQVALAGPMSENLRLAHEIGDWIIIADPLFSIAQLDRSRSVDDAILLDFSPEFDPYPGGRVVVTTSALGELDPLTGAVGKALSAGGAITTVLASISARLLLNLSNPTKQVVNGLAGLALTREFIRSAHPDALVLPIDGHEDMFVTRRVGGEAKLADLLAVSVVDGVLHLDVYESKWVGKQNLEKKISDAVTQAQTSEEVLRSEFIQYAGVDRTLRLDNLRRVILFHLERARRHGVGNPIDIASLSAAFEPELIAQAKVTSNAVVWCPDATVGRLEPETRDGTPVWVLDENEIDAYGRAMTAFVAGSSPTRESASESAAAALSELAADTTYQDLESQRESEIGEPHLERSQDEASAQLEQTRDLAGAPGGGSVESADTASALPPEASDECIRLGSILRMDREALWCPPRLSNGHLILVGGSGAGKTTALRHITGEIRQRGLPVVVLDFHGDILPIAGDERLFTFDYEGNSSFVNPFHVDARYGARLTPTRLKWEFVEAWRSQYPSMGIHQINFLTELIETAYESSGITDSPETWKKQISFDHILTAFEESEAAESVKVKIRGYMKRYAEWRIFHGGEGIAVERLLEESTRLDLSQLDESARNLLADVVLRRLFLVVRAIGPVDPGARGWERFRAYVVIDEAQLLMGGNSEAKASLSKYAAEARKFGLGLILATQLRDNVPAEIWGNIDTRLFMQALDPTERTRNAKAANVPENVLRSLARGQAILTSSSQPNQRPLAIQIEPTFLRR